MLSNVHSCYFIGGAGVSRTPEQLEDQGRQCGDKVHGGAAWARCVWEVDISVLSLRRCLQWREHIAGDYLL